ncbi:uncharacterized protein LOC131819487 isoform X2 [Mustela lutreola]|nr:uncharacterized protein LOC131819487 isoform X2 [Mustela lutreola]XP_059010622.1 uncharacterized protein LOC131819487 isoform X2 [Mustela lutreola]XP_059010623.1 uncharacterized protein LOC131819487 isoform X2 [Mustela lutreola]XP_059010624.1 uncharacterized protein LOC131819487 isoform X2 [Mustela lutreola]
MQVGTGVGVLPHSPGPLRMPYHVGRNIPGFPPPPPPPHWGTWGPQPHLVPPPHGLPFHSEACGAPRDNSSAVPKKVPEENQLCGGTKSGASFAALVFHSPRCSGIYGCEKISYTKCTADTELHGSPFMTIVRPVGTYRSTHPGVSGSWPCTYTTGEGDDPVEEAADLVDVAAETSPCAPYLPTEGSPCQVLLDASGGLCLWISSSLRRCR